MRLSTTLTSGLSAAAALVLLTACGGSDTDETATSGSSSASSAASTSSATSSEDASVDPDAEAFCTEAQEVFTDVESAGTSDPAALPALLAEASERISAIEAPAEISGSWDTLTQAFADIVADTQDLDLTTPEGQTAFTTALGSLQGEAAGAQAEVQTYVQANCDLPATPTS